MKVYVVQVGLFVHAVTTDRGEAERVTKEEGLRYTGSTVSEFRTEGGTESWDNPRENLHYRSDDTGRWNKARWTITTAELSTGTPVADPEKDFREHWADRFEEECGNHGRANGPGLIMAAHLMCPDRSGWGAEQDTTLCVVPYHTHTGGDTDVWLETCRREPPED